MGYGEMEMEQGGMGLYGRGHGAMGYGAMGNGAMGYGTSGKFIPYRDCNYSCVAEKKTGELSKHKSSLQFCIKEIEDIRSNRIVGIEFKCPESKPIFIFGAYLSADDKIENYVNELNILDFSVLLF